jgi:hypothetical protein
MVPEAMIVCMNFRVDDAATEVLYAAASVSIKVFAYSCRLLIVDEKFRISSSEGDGKLSWLRACQSGLDSNI